MNLTSGCSMSHSACSLSIINSSLCAVVRISSSSFSILLIFCLNSALVRERGLKASSKLEKNTFTVWHSVRRIFGLQSKLNIFRHHWSAALNAVFRRANDISITIEYIANQVVYVLVLYEVGSDDFIYHVGEPVFCSCNGGLFLVSDPWREVGKRCPVYSGLG